MLRWTEQALEDIRAELSHEDRPDDLRLWAPELTYSTMNSWAMPLAA